MKPNTIYHGNALDLIQELNVAPQLIVMSPPDVNETNYSLEEYKRFIHTIYSDCSDKLAEGGVMVSITTDTKIKGSVFTKHSEIINSVPKLNLFNYKIWAKTLKSNLYILTFCHMLFFCKGKKPAIKNTLSEFYPDVWLLESDKINDYPAKDSFPSELVKRIILTFTKENDVVLDPFLGSGKTAKIAKDNGRQFIGFELDEKFVRMARELVK